jgi:hypothetical protein
VSAEQDAQAPAVFLVRAVVREDLREAFDRWYEEEHLPQVRDALVARSARRSWSATDPGVHCAFYEFETLERLMSLVPSSPELKGLVEAFDQAWPDGVARTREVLEIVQSI